MACERRSNLGTCSHPQCAFSDQTDHGYECVDIVDGFCEVGLGCIPDCPHSFEEDRRDEALRTIEEHYSLTGE